MVASVMIYKGFCKYHIYGRDNCVKLVIGFLVGLQGSVDSNSTVGKPPSKSQTYELLW